MTKSQLIVQHIPYLRRYARALTGSEEFGRFLRGRYVGGHG